MTASPSSPSASRTLLDALSKVRHDASISLDSGVAGLSSSSDGGGGEEEVWQGVRREAKVVADALRTVDLRGPLGKTDLPPTVVSLLRLSYQASTEQQEQVRLAQIELLRVIANLCIDDDANRTVLLDASAPTTIISFLDTVLRSAELASEPLTSEDLRLFKTAIGAVLNLQLDHAPVRDSLVTPTSLSLLLRTASSPKIYTLSQWEKTDAGSKPASEEEEKLRIKLSQSISRWAWRVLEDLCGLEQAKAILPQTSIAPLFIPLLPYLPSDATPTTTTAAASHLSPTATLHWTSEETEDLIEGDADALQVAAELIEAMALDSESFRQMAIRKEGLPKEAEESWEGADGYGSARNPLDLLMAFLDVGASPPSWGPLYLSSSTTPTATTATTSAAVETLESPSSASQSSRLKTFASVKAAVGRAIVAVAGEDANMAFLFGEVAADGEASRSDGKGWFVERLNEWLGRDEVREVRDRREDLAGIALLALGNLARTDSHCLALVHEHDVVPTLARMLRRPDSNVQVQHGLVGLLKNLAIPPANKNVIGQSGVIESVAPFLGRKKDMVQPLQFGTVGLLKHLSAGNLQNTLRIVLPSPALPDLTATKQGEEGDEDEPSSVLDRLLDLVERTDDVPTRMEGTRVLVNVVKSLWSSSSSAATALPVGGNAREVATAKEIMKRMEVVKGLSEMVRLSVKYPVLVNEGVLGLTLVGSDRKGAALVLAALVQEPPASSASAEERERKPRQGSMDESAGSTTSQPPRPTSLDTIIGVLERSDPRMPPQFALNACQMLSSLASATRDPTGGRTVVVEEGDDEEAKAIREDLQVVKTKAQAALVALSGSEGRVEESQGHGAAAGQEVKSGARRALQKLRET